MRTIPTMRDYLAYYNNLDVAPFLQALEKQCRFYSDRKIDMFKDEISVPGLTLQYLFLNQKDVFYSLIDQKNSDLHWLMKDQIVGGPSLVFHRGFYGRLC